MIEKEPNIEPQIINACPECGCKMSNLPEGNGMDYLKREDEYGQLEIIKACHSCALDFIKHEGYLLYRSQWARKSLVQFRLRGIVVPR